MWGGRGADRETPTPQPRTPDAAQWVEWLSSCAALYRARPRPAGARLPWPLRLGPAAPLPLAAPSGGSVALPGASGPGPQRRTRRHRTIFSEEQLQALEALFVQNQYPDVGTRERLAGRIRLREERVEVGGRAATEASPWGLASFFFQDRLALGLPWCGGTQHRGGRRLRGDGAMGRRAKSLGGERAVPGACGKASLKLRGRKGYFSLLLFKISLSPFPHPDDKRDICSCSAFWDVKKCPKLQKTAEGAPWFAGG